MHNLHCKWIFTYCMYVFVRGLQSHNYQQMPSPVWTAAKYMQEVWQRKMKQIIISSLKCAILLKIQLFSEKRVWYGRNGETSHGDWEFQGNTSDLLNSLPCHSCIITAKTFVEPCASQKAASVCNPDSHFLSSAACLPPDKQVFYKSHITVYTPSPATIKSYTFGR